jgi:hypothetical protein
MEDHNWYILGTLDEVVNIQREPLRRIVSRVLDIPSPPIFVSDVYDKIIYVGIQLAMSKLHIVVESRDTFAWDFSAFNELRQLLQYLS